MGASGLICFDSDGKPVFEYSGFADKHNLPDIDDCYALNVADDAVWICYYSAFPLICLKNFQAARVWHEFGDSSAVAVRGSQAVRFPAYRKPYLVARDLNDSTETIWNLTDQDGILLAKSAGEVHEEELRYRSPFSVAARGSKIYVHTENALFELP
jgi:hypothetical protein